MCTQEKIEILKSLKNNGSKCLNRRGELFRNCVHKYKQLLGSINTRKKDENLILHKVPQYYQYSQYSQEINNDKSDGVTRSGRQWRKA